MNPIEVTKAIIDSGAISIRNCDKEKPFVYSSGNRGPGYVMMKGLVGQPKIFKFLISQLALKISKLKHPVDFVNGNVTGGVVPGWILRNKLSKYWNKELPFVYMRDARKQGGHNELIVGNQNNKLINKGMEVLIVEELVNFGSTTLSAVDVFRKSGYRVKYSCAILSYNHDETNVRLKDKNVELIPLINLDELLDIAEKYKLIDIEAIKSYREYLNDAIKWQLDRDYVIPEISAIKAIKKGYKMVKLSYKDALKLNAPKSKLDEGIVYYKNSVILNI